MKSIAIILARSGSKGLPDKNIKELCGKPLVAYSIEAASKSGKFDAIIVSTDSRKYADIAVSFGARVPFFRSKENSSDKAGSWDAVREVLDKLKELGEDYDRVMLLQPTSPLRTAEDIVNSFELMDEKGANAILGVVEMDHSPIWSNTLPEDGCMDNFVRQEYAGIPRQELPTYYRINGAIYLLTSKEVYKDKMFSEKCYAYVMPAERSIDIDTELDFVIAQNLIN